MLQGIPSKKSAWDHDDMVNQLVPQELDNLSLPGTITIAYPMSFYMSKAYRKGTHE
jgi:hypothetical protein